jgi:Cu+-exporting ATPase
MNAAQNIAAVELSIDGMTCASCAHRIEKKLNKLDGVTATVNFATEKAHVEYGDGVKPEQLVATVEEAGYQVHLPETPVEAAEDDPTASLRQRLLISAVLTVPVVAMAMVPALQFTYWQWLSLTLAAPVVVWGAWPFHRAAWANLRHGSATMDTLISMGTLAALGWSAYAPPGALCRGPAKDAFRLTFSHDGTGNIYPEAAAGMTTFTSPAAISRRGPCRRVRRWAAGTRRQGCLGAQRWCRATYSDRPVVCRR